MRLNCVCCQLCDPDTGLSRGKELKALAIAIIGGVRICEKHLRLLAEIVVADRQRQRALGRRAIEDAA